MTLSRLPATTLALLALAVTALTTTPVAVAASASADPSTVSPVVVPAASAVAPTCRGRAATLVGRPGSTITGTTGPDVVVTAGAAKVDTRAGDDLVCLTSGRRGPDPTGTEPTVRTGPGADTVLGLPAAQSGGFVHVDLGTGADRFTAQQRVVGGGAANYAVDTGDLQEPGDAPLPHDVVVGGAGDDEIRSGRRGLIDDDDLDGGDGFDQVKVRGVPTGRLDGGPGSQGDTLLLRTTTPAAWVLDAAGGGSVAGAPVDQRSFDVYDVTGLAWSRLRFVGTPGPDLLVAGYADGSGGSPAPLVADLGAGGDEVDLSTRTPATVLAGAGHDAVYLYEQHRLSRRLRSTDVGTDLVSGRVQVAGGGPVRLAGVEQYATFGFRSSTVVGTAGADDIYVDGCRALVRAGAGDDVVELQHASGCPGRSDIASRHRQRGLDAFGGPGDDFLYGNLGVDHLDGGPGRDFGTGGTGDDTCHLVERSVSCRRV